MKTIITKQEELDSIVDEWKNFDILAIDVETELIKKDNNRVWELDLYGIGLWNGVDGIYISTYESDIDISRLQEVFNSTKRLVMHNAKFDLMVLEANQFNFNSSELHDSMVMSFLVDENAKSRKLKDLAISILKYDKKDVVRFDDVSFTKEVQINMFETQQLSEDIIKMGEYCIDDCKYTFELYNYFKPILEAQNLWKLYLELEMPIILLLKDMQVRGVKLDLEYLNKLDKDLEQELVQLQTKIWEKLGSNQVNLNSAGQIAEILFRVKNLPGGKVSEKTGKLVLPKDIIETLAKSKDYKNSPEKQEGIEAARLLLEYREKVKLCNTYTKGLQKRASESSTIHTSFNTTIARTGRMSSTAPNLQNIPSRSDEYDIRRAFISREGYSFIIADFSQIELRLTAHCSGDETMIKVYQEGGDIHQSTSDLVGCSRKQGKTLNFGILYGMSDYALSKMLEISQKEAKNFIDNYFKGYKGVTAYIESVKSFVRKHSYAKTLTNRRRRLPEIMSYEPKIVAHAERQAVNFTIQGIAADLMKIAMRNIQRSIKAKKLDAHLLVQIHDEVICECLDKDIDEVSQIIKYEMENSGGALKVPLITEPEVSKFWKK